MIVSFLSSHNFRIEEAAWSCASAEGEAEGARLDSERARYSRSSKKISIPVKLLATAQSSLYGRSWTQARPRDMDAIAGL